VSGIRRFFILVIAIGIVAGAALSVRADDREVFFDHVGEAVARRTDVGNDGLINPASNLPDLIGVVIGGWKSKSAATNPFNGSWDDPENTGLFRVDIVFDGLLNPPGPIGLNEPTFDPYRYGPSPVYGFLEFDLDENLHTGGDIDNVWNRFLGNVSRFGGRVDSELGQRAATSVADLDGDLLTKPLVERSGEEWHLSLCGCDPLAVVNTFGDSTPNSFDAGDQWVVSARFIHRSHAFVEYSFAFGGSRPGEYDPEVYLMFAHDPARDETTVSLVYALTQNGAGKLAGASPEPIDLNAGNQTSIHEMVSEIRFAAVNSFDPGKGTSFDLLRNWRDEDHESLIDFLDPTSWEVNAIFGTSYSVEEPTAHYVWTDVGFEFVKGDIDGDGSVNGTDRDAISAYVAQNDGSGSDADGMVNGQFTVPSFGFDFSLFDLDYDGRVNAGDLRMLGAGRHGDIDADQQVDVQDLLLLRTLVGLRLNDVGFNPEGDLNRNGIIDRSDLRALRKILRLAHLDAGG